MSTLDLVCSSSTPNTKVSIEPYRLVTSRLLSSKLISLNVEVNGTIEDLIAKCTRICKLDNDMYKMLAEVQCSD